MTLVEKLRLSRSSSTAILHKFLTVYNPNKNRIYAFTEGEPDRVFYRIYIERYHASSSDVFVFNCEGKKNVYDLHSIVISRYPDCKRALFFVDKDVDEMTGVTWLGSPRIFTTEFYSIENYVICESICQRYFRDFTKIRKIEIPEEIIIDDFSKGRVRFQTLLMPLMAWIVAFRRRGGQIKLSDVKLDLLLDIKKNPIRKQTVNKALVHLESCKKNTVASPRWREVLSVCRELSKLDPRSYTRGHFESLWFISFLRLASADLVKIVKEGGGSVSFHAQINDSNYIQTLLTADTVFPPSLKTFLDFHLASISEPHVQNVQTGGLLDRFVKLAKNILENK